MQSAKEQSLKLIKLLDTTTYSFVDKTKLQYLDECVILSHQWVGKETTTQAYLEFLDNASPRLQSVVDANFVQTNDKAAMSAFLNELAPIKADLRDGIAKILKFCFVARQSGYRYAWIDTCCIDKDDKRLEAKAINSMWDYYSRCAHCFVYLSDVVGRDMGHSKWFTRGWTLQEMIAANNMTFFECRWNTIGSKKDRIPDIATACKIEAKYLTKDMHNDACIAVKMSWLSRRETGFDEDMAYCMLGLFGVQMDIRYGEGGENAFRRLQHALVKKHPLDESIFAWLGAPEGLMASGILAPWPSHFAKCSEIQSVPEEGNDDMVRPRIAPDEEGIEVQIPAKNRNLNNGADWNHYNTANMTEHKLLLHCQDGSNPSYYICVQMKRDRRGVWRRAPTDVFVLDRPRKSSKGSVTVTVPHSAPLDESEGPSPVRRGMFGRFKLGLNAAIAAREGQ